MMNTGIPTRTQVLDYAIDHFLIVGIEMSKDRYGNDKMIVHFKHTPTTDDGTINFRIRQDMVHVLAVNHGAMYGPNSVVFYKRGAW